MSQTERHFGSTSGPKRWMPTFVNEHTERPDFSSLPTSKPSDTDLANGETSRPKIAVRWDHSITYPSNRHFFSPSERFPEYKFSHLAPCVNPVYKAVRSCLADAELDQEHWQTPDWNPLGAYIRPGHRVFVLCNFVQHNDRHHSPERFWAKCTHGSVLRAVLDYVLLALKGRGEVCFGNAPIQSCDWSKVLDETGGAQVEEFYRGPGRGPLQVRSFDLRHHVVRDGILGGLQVALHAEDGDCVEVDLGKESQLEGLYDGVSEPQFRVLDYDSSRIRRCHVKGKHIYILHRRILESDVIVSVPKLKTHEKVGITGGIKGCVGAVAHKDCLAHHRFGPPSKNGDDYPDHLSFLAPISILHDVANGHGPAWLKTVAYLSNVFARKLVRRFTRSLGGSWPGNDTCWRMALDLARIVQYTDQHRLLQSKVQRHHIMVTDGVIAGEGDGPLSAIPVKAGYVAFADHVAAGDVINAYAMGFDPAKIPLLREALRQIPGWLSKASPTTWDLKLNGKTIKSDQLCERVMTAFAPPQQWRELLS